ncbi:ankyrin repeat domain protein [Ectocarpus siliculosus]|uniref:Ankyrin repeat domain protein n=1 Tax=Ectocarpus siliculosus TaxID=2880 RepID=D7G0H9_ECTSI|nr:ankyrin repeat domain protein [Ectocarpus siliculosus]|eukprot:CBJ33008.1 ankyrin repeat domain protein [Ectocarpus siliculosus]
MADRTHLHRAAQRGDIGAVRALVQAVDVNLRGGWRVESPLHAASRAGKPDVIACLVGAGAHTEVRDRNNDTPLLLAAWLGHATAIAKLLASGARVDADGIPRSALHCACMQGHAACVSELLRGGADETVEDEDGNSPAQVIGTMSESLERAEDIVLIREMLRRAPADRAWRRRGWLVMLRNRDCVAAGLLPSARPPPTTVTTRSAARRGARVWAIDGGGSRSIAGAATSPGFFEGQGLTTGHIRNHHQLKVHGKKKSFGAPGVTVAGSRGGGGKAPRSRRSPSAGGSSGSGSFCPPGKGHVSSNKKRPRGAAKRRVGKRGRGGAESEEELAGRQALASLVARLIGLGEEGAFRCVLSFL